MAKSKEQRQAKKDAKRQSKVDAPEAGEPTITPEPDLEAIAKRALEVQTEFERARESGTLEGGQGDKAMVRPTGAPHKDYQNMKGGWGYRMYDDGSIEIIAAPPGYERFLEPPRSFPKEGGGAFVAIEAEIEGKPIAPEPEAKVAPEVETKPAPAPALEAPVETETAETAEVEAPVPQRSLAEMTAAASGYGRPVKEEKVEGIPRPNRADVKALGREMRSDTAKAALDFPSRLGQAGMGITDVLGALTRAAAKKAFGGEHITRAGGKAVAENFPSKE